MVRERQASRSKLEPSVTRLHRLGKNWGETFLTFPWRTEVIRVASPPSFSPVLKSPEAFAGVDGTILRFFLTMDLRPVPFGRPFLWSAEFDKSSAKEENPRYVIPSSPFMLRQLDLSWFFSGLLQRKRNTKRLSPT